MSNTSTSTTIAFVTISDAMRSDRLKNFVSSPASSRFSAYQLGLVTAFTTAPKPQMMARTISQKASSYWPKRKKNATYHGDSDIDHGSPPYINRIWDVASLMYTVNVAGSLRRTQAATTQIASQQQGSGIHHPTYDKSPRQVVGASNRAIAVFSRATRCQDEREQSSRVSSLRSSILPLSSRKVPI